MEKLLKRWAMGRSLQEKKVKTNGAARGWGFIFPSSKLETERGLSALEGINWFRHAVHRNELACMITWRKRK
jgi:hypothetical protein